MARRTGAWKDARSVEAGARKWGTGINPVHSIYGEGSPRDLQTPMQTAGGLHDPQSGIIGAVPHEITDHATYHDYCDDYSAVTWGFSDDDGTSDRPPLGVSTEQFRGDTDLYRGSGFPSAGNYTDGVPGGSTIRSRNHGALVTKKSKIKPSETVSEGWEDKVHLEEPLNAVVSDPQQLIMQTSMMQRDRSREGSQRGEGSQSVQEPAHPIRSRIIGMRIKPWSGGERHYDMLPKAQEEIVRPWWSRRAGTADESLMEPNEYRPVAPAVRNPPSDPYQGADVGTSTANDSTFGYVNEDVLPYV